MSVDWLLRAKLASRNARRSAAKLPSSGIGMFRSALVASASRTTSALAGHQR
jgi:hypothetical protein